jgi:hypothetical protein
MPFEVDETYLRRFLGCIVGGYGETLDQGSRFLGLVTLWWDWACWPEVFDVCFQVCQGVDSYSSV